MLLVLYTVNSRVVTKNTFLLQPVENPRILVVQSLILVTGQREKTFPIKWTTKHINSPFLSDTLDLAMVTDMMLCSLSGAYSLQDKMECLIYFA